MEEYKFFVFRFSSGKHRHCAYKLKPEEVAPACRRLLKLYDEKVVTVYLKGVAYMTMFGKFPE